MVKEDGEGEVRGVQGVEGAIEATLRNTWMKERIGGVHVTLFMETIDLYLNPISLRKLSMKWEGYIVSQ